MTRSALLAVLLMLLVPGGASAATTIGSSLPAAAGDPLECADPGGCTFVPVSIAGTAVRVPYDGVIVRWAARVPAGATSPISLRVLRPASGGQFTAIGSHSATPGADGAIAGAPRSSSLRRLVVRAGDLIGVDLDAGERIAVASHPTSDSVSMTFAPLLGASETRAPDPADSDDFEALFNATVEPDADGDGYGDESQDTCPRQPLVHTGTCMDRPRVSLFAGQSGIGVVDVGKQITVTAHVTSPGYAVPNATLGIAVPAGLRPAALGGTAFCTVAGNQVTCPLGDLPANRGASVKVELLAERAVATEVTAKLTTGLPNAPSASSTVAIRVRTPERCGLDLRAVGGSARGTTGGDRITGTTWADKLSGREGDDCLIGRAGDDKLDGGDGKDSIDGGRGSDLMRGGAGNDRLGGGKDDDRVEGGAGNDVIAAVDGERDVVRCGPGRDSVRVDAIDSVAGCERVTRAPAKRR